MNLNSKSGSLASAPGLKECRQCHCTKPIRCFLRKNSAGLCIICDSCRETQMKRYYGGSQFTALFVERKKDMERNEKKPPIFAPKRIRSYLPIRPGPEKVEPVEKSDPGFPRTPTPLSSDSSSPTPYVSYLNTTPVPYSKWIQVTQFCQGMSDDSIPKARLITRRCQFIAVLVIWISVLFRISHLSLALLKAFPLTNRTRRFPRCIPVVPKSIPITWSSECEVLFWHPLLYLLPCIFV